MKFGKCEKCGRKGLINMHHILPQFKFGDGDTYDLCPNCHADYHEHLGYDGLHNDDPQFHLITFFKWLCGLGIIALLFYLCK